MEPTDPLAAVRDRVVARPLDATGADALRVELATTEARLGVPLLDEAEQRRLDRLAEGGEPPAWWRAVVAERDGVAVGYAGVVLPTVPGAPAAGDLALLEASTSQDPAVLPTLLAALEGASWSARAGRLQAWLRHVGEAQLADAADAGYRPDRRLGVLGRGLPPTTGVPVPAGVTVRPAREHDDDEAIVRVLAAAYADTDDGGWDLPRFRERTQLPWYRPEDVLLAEDEAGAIVGLHWLKRRSATQGEVHNLAIHPDGRGSGLGPALLHAGLEHLTTLGCDDVVLWVDRANDRAVRLYRDHGFTTRWDDVALGRTLRGGGSA